MNSKKYEIITFADLFISFGPLPKCLNLLDKYEFIQYNGIKIPRIPLNTNNSIDFKELLNGYKLEENENNIKKSNDKYLEEEGKAKYDYSFFDKHKFNSGNLINKDNYNIFNGDCKNKILLNNSMYLSTKKTNFINNEQIMHRYLINDNKGKEGSNEFIPPKIFISIFNKTNKELFDVDIYHKNNYNKINNIIFNNIYNINLNTNNLYIQNILASPKNGNNSVSENHQIPYNINNSEILKKMFSLINNNYKLNFYKSSNVFPNINKPLIVEQNQIIKPFKRRRKEIRKGKKTHTASDDDNILRKIQVHFLSFVTNYINDIIRKLMKDKSVPLFKNIDYKIKKLVNHKFIEELKSKNIAELLQLRPSPKLKIHDEFANKDIYNKICLLCPFMKEYLHRSYLSLFKEYYFNNNRIFIVNGEIIPLSTRTKTFNDLINKNFEYKEKIKYIAINYFLNKYKRLKKPNFKINVIKCKNKDKKKDN